MKMIEINSTGNPSLKPERFLWSIHKLNDVFDVGIDISELERDYYKEQLANGKVDAANIRKVKNKAALLDTKYKQSMQLEKENAEKEEEKLEEKNAEKVEEKKDEKKPFDVAENLKAVQEQLKNMKAENGGVVPEASAMKGPVSEIITSLKIMTVQKNGTLKNITRDQFAAINKSATLKDPSFDVIIKNTAPTALFDQATKGKGQDLYSNYMRAVEVSKKPVETSKKATELTNKNSYFRIAMG